MSYLGNSTTFQTVAPGIDYFSGNASTTTFQLSRQIVAVQDILVYIDNVPQNPSTAYSINTATNQITFTSAPLSGTNNIWVYYNTKSIQFLVPSPGTVSNSSLNSGSFSNITGVGTLSSLTVTNDASISGLTVGKGGGSVATNTAIGASALAANTSGANNSALGYNAGGGITAATDCVLLGNAAGSNITTGGGQTIIGSQAQAASATSPFGIVIGYNVTGQASGDYVTMGRSGAGKIYNQYSVNATWTQTSDGRLKKNIVEDSLGLSFINRLRPVKYEWKASNELEQSNPYYSETNERSTEITMHGLIAQEVKEALDAEGVSTFNGWDEGPDGIQSISREMFITPLIKAIQELKAEFDAYKATHP